MFINLEGQMGNRARKRNSFQGRGGVWVVAQIPLLVLAVLVPSRTGEPAIYPESFIQWLGVALVMAGVFLAVAGVLALGRSLTPFPAPRKDAELKTHGVYAIVRHPIYSGLIIASLGWSTWWLSWLGIVWTVVIAIFFDRKAAREEEWLRQKFDHYAAYQKAVKKLMPFLY